MEKSTEELQQELIKAQKETIEALERKLEGDPQHSNIGDRTGENLSQSEKLERFEGFLGRYKQKNNLKGKSYQEIMNDMCG